MTQEEQIAKSISDAVALATTALTAKLDAQVLENAALTSKMDSFNTSYAALETKVTALEAKEENTTKTLTLEELVVSKSDNRTFSDKGYVADGTTITPIEAWKSNSTSKYDAELVIDKSAVLSSDNSYDDGGTGIGYGQTLFVPGLVDQVRVNTRILDKLNRITVSAKHVYWMEYVADSGEFDCVGECELKPCVDFSVKRQSAEAKKLAAHLVICEEFFEDVPGVLSWINELFRRLHDDKLNAYVTEEIKDVAGTYLNPAYSGCIVDPNCADALEAAIVSANCKGCMPDNVMVSCAKYYKLLSTKNADGTYQTHPGITFTGGTLRINGIEVVINYGLADNEYILGDFKKATLAQYKQFSIRRGLINDQFIHNVETFVAESRFLFYIACNHQACFEFDTFDNVLTDIEK